MIVFVFEILVSIQLTTNMDVQVQSKYVFPNGDTSSNFKVKIVHCNVLSLTNMNQA